MTRYALLLLLMLPAACAAPGTTKTAPEATVEKTVAANDEPPAETPQEQTARQPDPPGINLLPPDHDAQAALPGDNALKPERLIGLLDSELEGILGTPEFTRNDPPAQLWQYRSPFCLFDVFLYQDTARANAYAVTHVEARGLDINRVSGRDCYLSVLKDRKQG